MESWPSRSSPRSPVLLTTHPSPPSSASEPSRGKRPLRRLPRSTSRPRPVAPRGYARTAGSIRPSTKTCGSASLSSAIRPCSSPMKKSRPSSARRLATAIFGGTPCVTILGPTFRPRPLASPTANTPTCSPDRAACPAASPRPARRTGPFCAAGAQSALAKKLSSKTIALPTTKSSPACWKPFRAPLSTRGITTRTPDGATTMAARALRATSPSTSRKI
ncbi:hypothetical protein BKA80DRAFT_277808 [Phyllosticta citrichinensis]